MEHKKILRSPSLGAPEVRNPFIYELKLPWYRKLQVSMTNRYCTLHGEHIAFAWSRSISDGCCCVHHHSDTAAGNGYLFALSLAHCLCRLSWYEQTRYFKRTHQWMEEASNVLCLLFMLHIPLSLFVCKLQFDFGDCYRLFIPACSILGRGLWFAGSFLYISVKGNPTSQFEAPIWVIAPHTSFIDVVLLPLYSFPSIIGKETLGDLPFFGSMFPDKICWKLFRHFYWLHSSNYLPLIVLCFIHSACLHCFMLIVKVPLLGR